MAGSPSAPSQTDQLINAGTAAAETAIAVVAPEFAPLTTSLFGDLINLFKQVLSHQGQSPSDHPVLKAATEKHQQLSAAVKKTPPAPPAASATPATPGATPAPATPATPAAQPSATDAAAKQKAASIAALEQALAQLKAS